ncbi:hypothetical protein VNO80_19521 [Phaseolus coccineus]|uniref:Uncharacterized protein n=1 Tax=Phaseolus coccineus TaxID=3886 RepID=A0AAN9QXF2_PHACN
MGNGLLDGPIKQPQEEAITIPSADVIVFFEFASENSSSSEVRLLLVGSNSKLDRVTNKFQETNLNPFSMQGCVSHHVIENKNERTTKRNEKERKVT